MEEKKIKGRFGQIVPLLLVCLLAMIYLFPILIMLSASFRSNNQIFDTSLGLWPEKFAPTNFENVFSVMPYWMFEIPFGSP